MIIKIKINKETLEYELEDAGAIVHSITADGDYISVEISKEDPQLTVVPLWQQ
jgi:hypothetical protein